MHQATITTEAIRRFFPALQREHNGYRVAYFDGPGGTQVPTVVAAAVVDYLLHHNANTHWAYPSSTETDEILSRAREAFADFLHCRPTEIVFGQNMTTITFHVARALGRSWQCGDEILITDLDHHANIDPWKDLAREHGFVIRSTKFNPDTGRLDLDHLQSLVSERTRLIAVGGASNALGTINDIKSITKIARESQILSYVDGVHYASHVLCDMQDLGCDFFACSPYKFYGPHAGVFYGRHELLERLDVPRLKPADSDAPERMETGTLSHEGITGSAAAVDFLASLTPSQSRRAALESTYYELHERSQLLFKHLWEALGDISGVTRYGPLPSQPRTPTLGFTVQGFTSEEACRQLSHYGLFLSHGDFYASTAVEKLGIEGLIRAGISCYTNIDEVDRLIAGVKKIKT
ncbi:MAG: cysteine desulfurase-like protein [Rhodothermaceae bacterium]|nr:cysteine desulfurase-like protein [Rhodothermaceae bacterium]MXW32672.1 cysteine desulfurase-like protein [Rhodothermaceae bacterium]MXX97140.1 cysteine desulfurase-like protein [Rhodothermaceae bacterium]MXZ17816.1 cysteine desulfurase-like protein [Rhodothermaceae bacterium]MXZ58755.1 cysteine desulfurase-like protein [Rhodothermaceae bacterium]